MRSPMNMLHTQLQGLATKFADDVVTAIRNASLDQITSSPNGSRRNGHTNGHASGNGHTNGHAASSGAKSYIRTTKGGRLARRSPEEIKKTLGLVVAALKTSKKSGMRAEEIRKFLDLDVREVPRVLKEGLSSKLLRSKGQKRATTYFAK